MKIINQHKFWIIAIIIIMVIASFWDYQLSVFLVKYSDNIFLNLYYRFFAIFGEFAFVFLIVLAFGLFFNFGLRKENSTKKYMQVVGNGIGLITFSFFQFLSFSRYLKPEGGNSHGEITLTMYIVSIALGLVLAFIVNKYMNNIKDEDYKYYKKVASVGVLYVFLLVLIVNGIKIIWARPGFWMVESGMASFVPWYIINGTGQTEVSNAYMSFVSGHTANAFSSIYLSLWSLKKSKLWFNIGMTWGACVAISRIFAGQHYISDIAMGGVIAFILFIVLVTIFKLSNYKNKL